MCFKKFKKIFENVPVELQMYIISFIPSKTTMKSTIIEKLNDIGYKNILEIQFDKKLIDGGKHFDIIYDNECYGRGFNIYRTCDIKIILKNFKDNPSLLKHGAFLYRSFTNKWYGRYYIAVDNLIPLS